MEQRSDRFAPALRTVALAVALAAAVLALIAVVAPRLGVTGSAKTTAPAGPAAVVAGPARLDRVPETPADSGETTTTAATTTTTATVPESTTTTSTTIPPDGAAIDVTIEMGAGDADEESSVLAEGDSIEWRIIITNTGDEVLWGAYAFLELHGSARCDSHQIAPGEATDCWIETAAVEGRHQAEIWATAWTETRMISDSLLYPFLVAPTDPPLASVATQQH